MYDRIIPGNQRVNGLLSLRVLIEENQWKGWLSWFWETTNFYGTETEWDKGASEFFSCWVLRYRKVQRCKIADHYSSEKSGVETFNRYQIIVPSNYPKLSINLSKVGDGGLSVGSSYPLREKFPYWNTQEQNQLPVKIARTEQSTRQINKQNRKAYKLLTVNNQRSWRTQTKNESKIIWIQQNIFKQEHVKAVKSPIPPTLWTTLKIYFKI